MHAETLIGILVIACVWVVPIVLIGLLVRKGSRRTRALDTDATS